jgi:hypothetical protein
LDTFVWLALYQAVAMFVHTLYRRFSRPQDLQTPSIVRSVLQRAGLYRTPSVSTLWFMGVIGMVGQLVGSGHGTLGKIGQSFSFVAWAPFLIPMFAAEVGALYCNKKKQYPFLFLYMGFIAFLGLAANARGMMLSGVMTIAIFSLLRALRGTQPVRATQIGQLVGLLLVAVAMALPLSDLMVAMTIARKARGTVAPLKMVEDTFYYASRPEQLKLQRERDKALVHQSSYDEVYFENPLLGRLMETKFHDNAMYFGSRLTARDQQRLWDVTGDFLWSTLPDPALKAIRVKVDKERLQFSMGDYLSYLGGTGDVGGFRTGSVFGQGFAMFGFYFPLVYLCLCPVLFLALDVLAYRAPGGMVLVSALGMLGIWKLFQYGITGESLQSLFLAVVRGLPQNIVMYLLTLTAASGCATALASLMGAAVKRHPQHRRPDLVLQP